MDPDAALAEIRDTMALIKAHRRVTPEQLDRMAELFEALDDWLTVRHGLLPMPWQHEAAMD